VLVALNAAASVQSVEPKPTDVQVVAEGVTFDRSEIVVEVGESGFWLDNRDGIRHTLTVTGTDNQIDAPGLSAQRADFELAPGVYEIFCAVPGHENMKIDLIVEG
jgi:plastocyanin